MVEGTVDASRLRQTHLRQVCTHTRALPGMLLTAQTAHVDVLSTDALRGQGTPPRACAQPCRHLAVLPAPSAIQPPEAPAQGTLAPS